MAFWFQGSSSLSTPALLHIEDPSVSLFCKIWQTINARMGLLRQDLGRGYPRDRIHDVPTSTLEAPNPTPHPSHDLTARYSLWAYLVRSPLCLSFFLLVSCAYARFARLSGSLQMVFSY